MDKKYIGRAVNLPKDTTAILQQVQEQLVDTLGFKPSLSDTVSYLCKQWQKQNNNDSGVDKPVEDC